MKSLRTDDIIGARPTFRHPPKTFIRQRKAPQIYEQQSFLQSNQVPPYQYKQSNFIEDINMSSSQYQQSPQMYQYKKGNYEIGNKNAPQMASRNQRNMKYYPDYSRMLQSNNRDLVNNAKQEKNQNNPEKNQNANINEIKTSQEATRDIDFPKQIQSKNIQPIISRKASYDSKHEKSSQNGESRHNSLFRGLGFNIITNTKYTYDFEKTFDRKDRSYSGI